MEILNAFGLIVVYLIKYYLIGTFTYKILKLKILKFLSLRVVAGFLVYQGFFFLITIPMIFLNASLTLLSILWIICIVSISIYTVVNGKVIIIKDIKYLKEELEKHWGIYTIIFIGISFIFILSVLMEQHGYDAVGYIGITNTTLTTDSLWKYYRFTGEERAGLTLRRMLSNFEINSAMCCKIYGIHPILEFRVIRRALNLIFTTLCYWYVGKNILNINKKRKHLLLFVINVLMINLMFLGSDYTNSRFLLTRTYEGKAFCGNCIVLFCGIISIEIIKRYGKIKKIYLFLFLVNLGAIAVSASSMYLEVIIYGVILGAAFVQTMNIKYLKIYLIACVPSIICMMVAALENVGIISCM